MLKHCVGLCYRTVGLLSVLIALFISNIAWAEDLFTFHAQTGDSIALSGLNVYAFTESGSYTGKNKTTDENGDAVFDISDLGGGTYKFRLDYLGQQIWSDVVLIPDETSVTLTVQQRNVPVTVESNTGVLAGYRVYLFTSSGSYMGLNQTTDINGQVFFDLPIGAEYKFRADYLGYQFWSDEATIESDTVVDLFIPQQDVTITVQGLFDTLLPMQGVRVYLFTASGSYMSQYQNTDQNGQVVFTLPEKGYKVRADYLGRQYWSDEIIWQDTEITVPMADAEITVSGGGQPLSNVNVYVFNENSSYLSISGTTDNDGMITFRLPEGSYKFRADYQGSQYWSNIESLNAGQVNPISISTGGGSFELTVLKGDSEPLADVNCYVFSESGSYLGMTGITNNDGLVSFDLSDGNYKFRIDCLGYQFWSDVYEIPATLAQDVMINHQDVTITVNTGYQSTTTPLEGVKAYLFTAAGTYMNQNFTTDMDGQVVFSLPNQAYKVRVDYMNQQFWSDEIIQQGTGITISMADAEIQVSGNGQPIADIPVYVFTGSGAYLNLNQLTDQDGSAVFRLPASGTYKFRADYQGSQYWTNEVSLLPDQFNVIELSTGGGTFSFTVLKGTDDPLVGVNCYVFSESGSYLGLTAATNSEGLVTFNLADGPYQIRVDYLGYQYWSDVYEVPVTLMDTLLIAHQETTITVSSEYQQTYEPLSGVPVYLFTQSGSYMNQNQTTDANGQVVFNLPENTYKVRADYMRQQFWSDEIMWQDQSIGIPMSEAEILVSEYGLPLENVPVYVFVESGAYLGVNGVTDIDGIVSFRLPAGNYKFRADFQGEQYWSDLETLEADESKTIYISNVITWTKIWGNDGNERAYDVVQAQDGGYVFTGYTDINTDTGYDILIVKFDVNGNLSWQTTFGSTGYDGAKCIQQTNDGGYIIAGSGHPYSEYYSDATIIKTNSSGQLEWQRYFGGYYKNDSAVSVFQTHDNGYIITGNTWTFGAGESDIWLIRTDENGNAIWHETFGGVHPDAAYKVLETSDLGYIIGGTLGGRVDGVTRYCYQGVLIKTDQDGQEEWRSLLGEEDSFTHIVDLQQTDDSGYIAVSDGSYSFSLKSLVKFDEYGNVEWIKEFTDSRIFHGQSIQQTDDNGYIITGYVGAGGYDIKLLKTDSSGTTEWESYFGNSNHEYGYAVDKTKDQGYVIAGFQYDIEQGFHDAILIKTDAQGNAPPLSE